MTSSAPPAITPVEPITFVPGVRGHDALAQYWLGQVMLRLRREVSWLWRERSLQTAGASVSPLPPLVDRALSALDLVRYEHDKRTFFAEDVTARYLSERIAASEPPASTDDRRGSFAWIASHLELQPVERFVLAVALLRVVDSAAGHVIASCLNDPSRTSPTLELAQRLWDEPDQLVRCFDPAHTLVRHGLLNIGGDVGSHDWQSPLRVPSLVASELLFGNEALPAALESIAPVALPVNLEPASVARAVAALTDNAEPGTRQGMRIVPLVGAIGAPLAEVAAACAERAGVGTVQPSAALAREHLGQALTAAWLRGHAVYLPPSSLSAASAHDAVLEPPPLPGLPLPLFVGVHDRAQLRGLDLALPTIVVPPSTYAERLAYWQQAVPSAGEVLPELARRFRYEQPAIARVGRELATLGRAPSAGEMLIAARGDLDLGTLAQPVTPRFARGELMLPAVQSAQIDEIVAAMTNLTRVHHEWGTARAWSEGGLAALFAGGPGTGKTMTAEVIAAELSLPLYRIDLSQVVNKYIGETEKRLAQVFDECERGNVMVLFDEADALFGQRTRVRDAHDRFANIEIDYLLQRMESFDGLAILATNRRGDLDPGFVRRIRMIVDFLAPTVPERHRLWELAVPVHAPSGEPIANGIDRAWLAEELPLTGAEIKSVALAAAFRAHGAGELIGTEHVLAAARRELAKKGTVVRR
jgi:ATPase family associated with various cellular activities (AAA)